MDKWGAEQRDDVALQLRTAGCVFAEEEADVLISAAGDAEQLSRMVARRVDGSPLEHVVGFAEFYGMRVPVSAGVFVPRVRSEHLVAQAVSRLEADAVVIDMCCGAGGIGMALMATGATELHAVDIELAAVDCARSNLKPLGAHVHQGDMFDPLPSDLRGRVDLVVANAPYVPTDEIRFMPREARLHEPAVALDGGEDGVDLQRRIAVAAPAWLRSGGHLLIETGSHQAELTMKAMTESGLSAELSTDDELEATVVIGTKP